jgi:hypothetical protein
MINMYIRQGYVTVTPALSRISRSDFIINPVIIIRFLYVAAHYKTTTIRPKIIRAANGSQSREPSDRARKIDAMYVLVCIALRLSINLKECLEPE